MPSNVKEAEKELGRDFVSWGLFFWRDETRFDRDPSPSAEVSTLITLPTVTGPFDWYVVVAGTGVGASRTGLEYGTGQAPHQFRRVQNWGIEVVEQGPEDGDLADGASEVTSLQDQARTFARAHPHVEITMAEVPRATGNVISDLRVVGGLTTADIAELGGVDTETVGEWRDDPSAIPRHARSVLEAARAIGSTLVGSLGAGGVANWLLSGPDSPMLLLSRGHVEEAVKRAERYRQTIAT